MPLRLPEKIEFLTSEIAGLKSRMGTNPNAVQRHKLEMWRDIQSDYQQSLERDLQRKTEEVGE